MAYYPASIKNDFTTKVNYTDIIWAAHVNDLQGEVTNIETYIGASPHVSSGWVGTFDQVTTTWNTLKDRIQNIEYGLNKAYNSGVSTAGGSTIQSLANSTISLIFKAKSGQTANLAEFQLSDGTVVSKVDASGNIYTSNKQVVPIVYSATQPSSVPVGTIWVDSSSNIASFTTKGIGMDDLFTLGFFSGGM